MDIDLNENNYDYDKLLKLFALSSNFTKKDLRHTKKKVLKLHPDLSKLPNNIYLFMMRMYCKLETIYNYSNHETNEHELSATYEADSQFKTYLDENNIDPVKNYTEFSKQFNHMFENVYISDDDYGYSEWLKSNDDIYDKDNLNESRKKAINNGLMKIEDINEVGANVFMDEPNDLKEIYSNPIVAIDIESVYDEKQKFSSVQEYQTFLAKEDKDNKPLSDEASLTYIQNKEKLLNNQSRSMAFNRMNKNERINKNYSSYVSRYLKIENNNS